ncbi:unnamed protein product [Microthlaspi erraticum]|nr:unnamed protein product [Microthlaspi erraticum]
MEVFDPKTQTWEFVMCPLAERYCSSSVDKSAVIEGRIFHMFRNESSVVYSPKEDRWELRSGICMTILDLGWSWLSYCVIDNVLYYCDITSGLRWFDFKRGCWVNLKGLKRLPRFAGYGCVKISDCGGKMGVCWIKYFRASGYKESRIWCAVIALERRNGDEDEEEIWGTVELIDPVLTVPNSCRIECVLAATV